MDIVENQPVTKRRASRNRNSKVSSQQIENEDKKRIHKKHIPTFRLKTEAEVASLTIPRSERVPLMLTDIQYLLLHSIMGNLNLTHPPRWYVIDKCSHISQTTAIILEGISLKSWEKFNENMTKMKSIFSDNVEILTPAVYNGSFIQELAQVPLFESNKETLIQEYGSMNLALEVKKDLIVMMKTLFPINNDTTDDSKICTGDKFPRTQLISSASQLIEENYPVPLRGKLKIAYSDYVLTKDEYKTVSRGSPMFGLDCEMCQTDVGLELTRVSVVNEKHDIVYESLVKPYNNITDYLTRYSGITKSLLNNVTKRLEDVQKDLRELLPPDAILVGQSLNIDLHALKMMHPYVIDTSLIYNFVGERTRKPKLKVLAREFLNVDIQSGRDGHCSVEDSIASMKLVQLKLSNSLEFGNAIHTNRKQYKDNIIAKKKSLQYASSLHILEQKKTSVVIGGGKIIEDYNTYITKAERSSQLRKSEMKKVQLIASDDDDVIIANLAGSVSDYRFSMAHLKLELDYENELQQMLLIDQWIETIWKSIPICALCVIVIGGTISDNGVAMIKVKSRL